MQFVRAPDENVFIAPFNLIEIVCLIIPFEWWMPRGKQLPMSPSYGDKLGDRSPETHSHSSEILAYLTTFADKYEKLNDYVMGVIYSPLLFVTALLETRTARIVKFNRSRQESDDDTIEEWEQLEPELDVEGTGWSKRVEDTSPDVIVDGTLLEVRKLMDQVKELKTMLRELTPAPETKSNGGSS